MGNMKIRNRNLIETIDDINKVIYPLFIWDDNDNFIHLDDYDTYIYFGSIGACVTGRNSKNTYEDFVLQLYEQPQFQYIHIKELEKLVITIVKHIHDDGIEKSKNDCGIAKEWDFFTKGSLKDYEVIRPVWGISFKKGTSEITLGPFCIMKSSEVQGKVNKSSNQSLRQRTDEFLERYPYLIAVHILAKSENRALELATPYFALFDDFFKFLFHDVPSRDGGVYKFANPKLDEAIVLWDNDKIKISGKRSGAHRPISEEWFREYKIINEAFDIIDKFKEGCATDLEQRIIRAIHYVGLANAESDKAVIYSLYMVAVEALLQSNAENGMVSPSITYQISEAAAFIISAYRSKDCSEKNTTEMRKSIFQDFKALYNNRSRIVHGNIVNVNVRELKKEQELVYELINDTIALVHDKKYSGLKEIHEWLNDLRFS